MPKGVYLVEASAKTTNTEGKEERLETTACLLYVSDLFVISEELHENKVRLAVVSAKSGLPVSGATIRLTTRYGQKEDDVTILTTNHQGEALYSSFYPDSSYQTITAVPAHGFRFSHWNDGDTTNPRTVFVTQDTAFTAYFLPAPLHSGTVRSSNNAFGYTTGDSTYYENDPAVIKAVPLTDRYRFTHWNDGDTVNPRTIIVTQDTAFTAHFASPQGIAAPDAKAHLFTLTPNPARSSVTVTINPQLPILNSQLSMTLTDAAGRELLNTKVTTLNFQLPISQYPAGTYFVTLRTPDATSTQRLVIK
jgi:hypothetical protein